MDEETKRRIQQTIDNAPTKEERIKKLVEKWEKCGILSSLSGAERLNFANKSEE